MIKRCRRSWAEKIARKALLAHFCSSNLVDPSALDEDRGGRRREPRFVPRAGLLDAVNGILYERGLSAAVLDDINMYISDRHGNVRDKVNASLSSPAAMEDAGSLASIVAEYERSSTPEDIARDSWLSALRREAGHQQEQGVHFIPRGEHSSDEDRSPDYRSGAETFPVGNQVPGEEIKATYDYYVSRGKPLPFLAYIHGMYLSRALETLPRFFVPPTPDVLRGIGSDPEDASQNVVLECSSPDEDLPGGLLLEGYPTAPRGVNILVFRFYLEYRPFYVNLLSLTDMNGKRLDPERVDILLGA